MSATVATPATTTPATTTFKLNLTPAQVEVLRSVFGPLLIESRASPAAPRPRRISSMPKGVTPPHLAKWNAYVDTIDAELKSADVDTVWAEWAATAPMSKPRKGSDKVPEPLATDEKRATFKVIRSVAMRIARTRRDAGLMPAEFVYKSASSSDAETAPKKQRKARTPAPVPVPVPVAAPATMETDDEAVEFAVFEWKKKTYKTLPAGDDKTFCWIQNADGSRGKWAGLFDPTLDKMDKKYSEPTLDEE